MSSNTVILFPSLPQEDLTPLDIATLERAAWQLEAMNALLAESSLPQVKDGDPYTGNRIHPRSDPPTTAANEDIKNAVQASPISPGMTLVNEESFLFSAANDSLASIYTSDSFTLGPSPSVASDISSEPSYFEEVYRMFTAPIRVPLAPKDTNTLSPMAAKKAPHSFKANKREIGGKENQNPVQPRKLTRRKAICYPSGVRPTKVIPITPVAAYRARPCITQSPPPPVSAVLPSLSEKVSYQDFAFRHLLGSGSQGRVYLARYHRDARSLLAIKVVKKGLERDTECIMQEHKVLKKLRGSPFILNLQAAFNDSLNWYLVTDYYCGGDLQTALFKQGHFDENTTRFYATEIILALKFLHDNGIIHRDMKLSNVLLRKDGHIAIADYGLVHNFHDGKEYKVDADGSLLATGCCGTRTHMAPEVLQDKSYTCAADWWSFGICFFAMLQGELPWSPENIRWSGTGPTFQPLAFNPDIATSNEALSLIHGLLQKLPQFRMGCSDLQVHSFFAKIDWDEAGKMGLCPPFLPRDDGEILVDQPLPRYLDFLRGATEPLIPDRFPDFYYLSPALGGEISPSSLPDQPMISVHEAHNSPPSTQPLEGRPNIFVHPPEESTFWPMALAVKDDLTLSASMQSVSLLSVSSSNHSSVDVSIPLGNSDHFPSNNSFVDVSIPHGSSEFSGSTPQEDGSGTDGDSPSKKPLVILDWIVSVGRKLFRSFKRCCKTTTVA